MTRILAPNPEVKRTRQSMASASRASSRVAGYLDTQGPGMSSSVKLDVFGKRMVVERDDGPGNVFAWVGRKAISREVSRTRDHF